MPYLTKTCELCGATFTGMASRLEHRRFCSRACYDASRTRTTKVCPVCEQAFSVPPSNAHRYIVCSWECRTASTEYATCRRCGERFTVHGAQRHYCSEDCRRPPHYQGCEECGEQFRVLPSLAESRRFCCLACWRRHNGESRLEARMREALEAMGMPFEQEMRVGRYSIDFALPLFGVALEVDGAYWHQDHARDLRKTRTIERHGWRVVRIPEKDVMAAKDLGLLLKRRLAR